MESLKRMGDSQNEKMTDGISRLTVRFIPRDPRSYFLPANPDMAEQYLQRQNFPEHAVDGACTMSNDWNGF